VRASGIEKGPGVKAPSVSEAQPKMRPGVGVGVIIKKDGKVLLQKRIGAHGAGSWSFPGGHLEYGESPEQTAVRETLEEVGVSVRNPKVVGVTNDISHEEGKHYITIFVEADYVGGEAKANEPDRVSEVGWFALDNLPSPLFLPLKNFVENKRLL